MTDITMQAKGKRLVGGAAIRMTAMVVAATLLAGCGAQYPTRGVPEKGEYVTSSPQIPVAPHERASYNNVDDDPLIVMFDTDSHDLSTEAERTIRSWVNLLQGKPHTEVLLQGHADERGSDGYNYDLALRRAETVKDSLVQQGIEAWRISVASESEWKPRATGNMPWAWDHNRRVRLILLDPERS